MPRPRINSDSQIGDPWEALSKAINDTIEMKQSALMITKIMKICTDLVNKGETDLLYNGLKKILQDHFVKWHNQLKSLAGDPLLSLLSDQCEQFQNYCSTFPRFYLSYDNYFKREPKKTFNLIKNIFVDKILSDKKLFWDATTPSIISVIEKAQKGNEIDLSKIQFLIDMYYLFKDDASEIFNDFKEKLEMAELDFYSRFFETNFNSHSFQEYLLLVERQFELDQQIFNKILKPEEVRHFLEICHCSLLLNKQKDFLDGAEPAISQALISPDLRPLRFLVKNYQDFKSSLAPVYTACANYIMNEMLKLAQNFPEITKEGKTENKTQEKKKTFDISQVGQLIDLTIKLSDPYTKIFEDKEPINTLNTSIKNAWNNERFNITSNFNEYIDSLVKDEFKGSTVDDKCKIINRFYKYINDKNQFNNYFESSFVRRLIKMKSKVTSYDIPIINTIRKIQTNFMPHLDDFMRQYKDSEQIKDDYLKSVAGDSKSNNVTIDPMVFLLGTFPLPKDEETNIPNEVKNANSQFINFYIEKHKQQMLILTYHCSTCEFSYKVPSKGRGFKTYSITTDLPCACVLSALAQKPYRFGDICSLLNNRAHSSKIIQKLTEQKLIQRKAESNKLTDNDIFSLNPNFSKNKTKIIIPPVLSEKKACQKETIARDQFEKKDAVDAAIVRTLKQKGRLEEGVLERFVMEILSSKFTCTAEMIKREVHDLKQYVKIEEVNGQIILTYIA